MIIGVLGSGGREHSICKKLIISKKVKKLYCFPGNAGTSLIAENIELDITNFEKIKDSIIENKIDFLIIGPEQPLVNGIVDYLQKYKIKVFGPKKIAAQLEGSKIFTKKICEKYNIPTAKFKISKTYQEAISLIRKYNFPLVVKADGLAAGKGVYICEDYTSAEEALNEIFNGKFGVAKNVLLEEFLTGQEMSYFILSDGKTFKKFQTAQDHKRVLEGDKGKNTGGMGAYSPSALINDELDKKIIDKIIKPTLKALHELGSSFEGFLYAGLMIVDNEPYLIEYNVRMGDPECQAILPLLKTDLVEIIIACFEKQLEEVEIDWFSKKSLCIVVCSKGYPDNYQNNIKIHNIKNIITQNNQFIYQAGTKNINNETFSNGGRVINFVVLSDNFKSSRDQAIELIKKLDWSNGFYRKDIGFRVID